MQLRRDLCETRQPLELAVELVSGLPCKAEWAKTSLHSQEGGPVLSVAYVEALGCVLNGRFCWVEVVGNAKLEAFSEELIIAMAEYYGGA